MSELSEIRGQGFELQLGLGGEELSINGSMVMGLVMRDVMKPQERGQTNLAKHNETVIQVMSNQFKVRPQVGDSFFDAWGMAHRIAVVRDVEYAIAFDCRVSDQEVS